MQIRANNIQIELEDSAPGRVDLPVVLLIMGLGMQLIAWPPGFVRGLITAGYRVIRLDNRDAGLSQSFAHLGAPNLLWHGLKYKLGLPLKPPYTVHDMALDALGVLDALSIAKAHILGVSMGGMIAQRVAIEAPQRTLSLTSIMSSSGARGLPGPSADVTRQLLTRAAGKGKQAAIDQSVKFFKAIGSPGFAMDEALLRQRVTASYERNVNPAGLARQMLATVADATRADQLAKIRTPTLVLHGQADPLVPFACGDDTARRILGARLVGIEGMGHDLPPGAIQLLLDQLLPHLSSASKPVD